MHSQILMKALTDMRADARAPSLPTQTASRLSRRMVNYCFSIIEQQEQGAQLCSTVGQSRVRITILESSRNGYFQPITECSTWTKQMLITT